MAATRVNFRSIILILMGLIAGLILSIGLDVSADKPSSGLPIEDLRKFASVFGTIKANYVDRVEDSDLIKGAVSGMLSGLDPHSSYLDPEAFRDLQVGTQGEFGGLGIEVGTQDGLIRVVAPIEDTPAARAGIKAGDLITKIDDKATKGMSLGDAVKLMRGRPKTKISLTVLREGESSPITIEIIRDIIQVTSVRSKLVEEDIGFLRISQFQEKTVGGVVKNFNKLVEAAKTNDTQLKGLVLDLRNDPGGLLNAAVGVSAAFLKSGVKVVYTNGRQPDSVKEFFARPEDYARTSNDPLTALSPLAKNLPMVVLINGGSASASEIVAGALQDHKRAKVLGTQSFGKGSVQTILPLTNNTAIKLTTARYFTPLGQKIQAKGIKPDFWVEETESGDVFDRDRVREADLSRHLDSNKKSEKAKERDDNSSNSAKALKDPIEFGSDRDFQLKQAINLLKGLPVKTDDVPEKFS